MGGKTKAKQQRKQSANQTKKNGGRNGVSGHMKKTIGNGKRASGASEDAESSFKKSSKNVNNKQSTNMKRKRDDDDDDNDDKDDDAGEGDAHEDKEGVEKNGIDDNTELKGSSLFTAADDNEDNNESKKQDHKKKKKKLVEPLVTEKKSCKFIELEPTKLTLLEDSSFSRLLYPNPVCFLTTIDYKNVAQIEESKRLTDSNKKIGGLNVMTLSWITPVNNYGGFAFAIHKTRFSAANLLTSKKFTLSVATAQSKELVLAVGKSSGKMVNKFDNSIPSLQAGTFGLIGKSDSKTGEETNKNKNGFGLLMDSDDEDEEDLKTIPQDTEPKNVHYSFPPPIDGTVAHMYCDVLSYTDGADEGHYLVIAKINKAAVHTEYWDGKCFITSGEKEIIANSSKKGDNEKNEEEEPIILKQYPPILSFLGSQKFGHMIPE
mmetsp:Transcript_9356/g.9172  ORF Transcript_9356/g.9172 Transcript_9356/m.9172 type:complete len:432 (+) Transcript_9356:107-1402(+)|eukprot:CAMPEP_0119038052 /NCGR_PEP_ID=MMETSP1177-20130426/6735_1 /TAXON_ID=2985 /ORGANISM="Ochromonas sp, Strain CCMP1899" /LENGTH=431 /DNA_ID=CAMNT_0007000121 /DNA_START=63 /DNA_END=1358 /DNA_ORIENTATION=-